MSLREERSARRLVIRRETDLALRVLLQTDFVRGQGFVIEDVEVGCGLRQFQAGFDEFQSHFAVQDRDHVHVNPEPGLMLELRFGVAVLLFQFFHALVVSALNGAGEAEQAVVAGFGCLCALHKDQTTGAFSESGGMDARLMHLPAHFAEKIAGNRMPGAVDDEIGLLEVHQQFFLVGWLNLGGVGADFGSMGAKLKKVLHVEGFELTEGVVVRQMAVEVMLDELVVVKQSDGTYIQLSEHQGGIASATTQPAKEDMDLLRFTSEAGLVLLLGLRLGLRGGLVPDDGDGMLLDLLPVEGLAFQDQLFLLVQGSHQA